MHLHAQIARASFARLQVAVRGVLSLAAPLLLVCALPAAHAGADPVQAEVERAYPGLEALYQDLHRHPELGFQEHRTAARLASEMRALGFTVTEGVGGTGLVALYENGAGPTVLVRTELDALPMEEKTGLPYASTDKAVSHGRESFVDHACGHDVHMTAWVGTARTLLAMRGRWHGRLMFIAQPAEEIIEGARAMLDDGLFTRFPRPDYVLAIHTSGQYAYGTVAYTQGPAMSSADSFEIVFHGRGSHGSAPHTGIDPIVIAARFVTDVQAVATREKDPREFGVITVGAFQAGTVGNIIPDEAVLRGTVRSYRPEVRARLLDGLRHTAEGAAAMAGAPAPTVRLTEHTDAVINDEALTDHVVAALRAEMGPEHIVLAKSGTASEDFSVYGAQGIPSLFLHFGVYDPERVRASEAPGGTPLPYNHSPLFAPVAQPSIQSGMRIMSTAVLSLLGNGAQPPSVASH